MSDAVLELPDAMKSGMTLAYHTQQAPDRMAVITDFGERTFGELNARANQLARVFREAGLRPDDGVAMLLTNRPEFAEVYYACMRAGFRVTPINWHLTGDNASYIVDNSEAKAFIADVRCSESAIEALRDNHSQLKVALAAGGSIEGFDDYDDVVTAQDPSNIEDPDIGSQMLYTSGTTGRPKGVYRERNPQAAAGSTTVTRTATAASWNPETDRALMTGPAYHAAPLAFNLTAPSLPASGRC
ncbi:MAG: AMP-binding protein [Gammaproteobacteria bacterium]|nr:AMP-binding protein [Gammaproteobacteria bacterium]